MLTKTPAEVRWHFSTGILLPVLLALVVTAAGVLGFIFWSAASVDERALDRQNTMVAHMLISRSEAITRDQASLAVWDDAVRNTALNFNLDWTNFNIGLWSHSFFEHDQTILLNSSGRAIYMMVGGKMVANYRYNAIAPTLEPLFSELRTRIQAGQIQDFLSGRSTQLPGVTDFAVIEGKPALVAMLPIISDTRSLNQVPGSEVVLVSIVYLGNETASRITQNYMLEDAAFVLVPSQRHDRAVHPVTNKSGRFVAFFEWERERPGRLMLIQTGPVLTIAFAIAAILVILLLMRLRHSSQELEAGKRHAEYQAAHDRLTGLPNRTTFDDVLASVTARLNLPVTLLMLDLDRFKQVNDTLGHQAGDDLITAVSKRLRSIVGQDVTLARLGGDEFALILVGDETGKSRALAQKIIAAIREPFPIGQFKVHVGVSIGMVEAAVNGLRTDLVRHADIALYEAKAAGRNRAVVYEEHMGELLQLHNTIESELREALILGDQLSVSFQPLIDQETRKVIGAEALTRWQHPKYGQISPTRFIAVAENTGLIERLGEFILRRACELGASAPGRTIAVNISPTQLRNPGFSALVFDVLHQTGMRPVDLELEITESILLDDENVSSLNLRTFRDAGIHIALDDFGTGYSSLSYLKRYPVDRIKIDRSFVSQLALGHVSVAITEAIVKLAHAMSLEVTAEGVETEDQARILAALGCNIFQGFLFSSAVPAARIKEIFADPCNAIERRRRTNVA